MRLLIAFIAVPLIEIGLFIQVGGAIGLWPTLAIVILTAFLGTTLLRQQGGQTMREIQRSFHEMRDPSEPMAHGAMILFAGALLLTPGFFTDALGLALMIPGVRRWAFAQMAARVDIRKNSFNSRPDVIDAEFQDVSEKPDPNAGPSGWTKD